MYAFDSTKGQIDNSHTVGSRDGGVYIGQCFPCDAPIDHVLSEHNGLGYLARTGGNLLIVNSTFRNNCWPRVEPAATSCATQTETTIVGNLVYSNNQGDTPAIDGTRPGQRHPAPRVTRRRNRSSTTTAPASTVPFLEEDPNDDLPTPEEWSILRPAEDPFL